MIIGSLGKTIFGCSEFYTKTPSNMTVDKASEWVEHRTLDGIPKLQFKGVELDIIKFNIHLNAAFKVNPLAASKELENYMKNGEVLSFMLGGKKIGTGKYVITNMSETHKTHSAIGTVTKMELSINLKEYR